MLGPEISYSCVVRPHQNLLEVIYFSHFFVNYIQISKSELAGAAMQTLTVNTSQFLTDNIDCSFVHFESNVSVQNTLAVRHALYGKVCTQLSK